MKSVSFIQRNTQGHWVGDGFPVRTLFSYNDDPAAFSPFLMLDYGGPVVFEPTTKRRGVGAHPHRGFETVTIVYDGEVTHRDSSGGGGTIGPGEVQWMRAGSGISRMHCTLLAERGRALVRDHSRYGTFVNGERVAGEAELGAGDRLRVGTPGVVLELVTVG